MKEREREREREREGGEWGEEGQGEIIELSMQLESHAQVLVIVDWSKGLMLSRVVWRSALKLSSTALCAV